LQSFLCDLLSSSFFAVAPVVVVVVVAIGSRIRLPPRGHVHFVPTCPSP
jgi:hypothetical protein